VLADFADGVPVSVLAERFEARCRSTRPCGRDGGWRAWRSPCRVLADEVNQIVGLYTDGVSPAEIGKRTELRPVRLGEGTGGCRR